MSRYANSVEICLRMESAVKSHVTSQSECQEHIKTVIANQRDSKTRCLTTHKLHITKWMQHMTFNSCR